MKLKHIKYIVRIIIHSITIVVLSPILLGLFIVYWAYDDNRLMMELKAFLKP